MDQWLKSGGNENRHANTMTHDNILNVKNRFKDKRKEGQTKGGDVVHARRSENMIVMIELREI